MVAHSIDTDALAHRLAAGVEGLGTPPYLVVVDANTLMSSIAYQARKKVRPALVGVSRSTPWRVFATTRVFDEVARRLVRLSGGDVDLLEQMRRILVEEYRPVITWVEVDPTEHTDPRVRAVGERDPDDLATAVLAELVAPCVVWSDDGDLIDPGVADGEWRSTSALAMLVVEGRSRQESVALFVSFPMFAVGAASRRVAQRAPAIGYFALGAAAGVVLVLLASPDLRAAVRARLGKVMGPIAYALLDEFIDAVVVEAEGKSGIAPRAFSAGGLLSPRAQVARVLARSDEPLLAREIRDVLLAFDERSAPPLVVVREVLSSSPEFRRHGRYRWAFGAGEAPTP